MQCSATGDVAGELSGPGGSAAAWVVACCHISAGQKLETEVIDDGHGYSQHGADADAPMDHNHWVHVHRHRLQMKDPECASRDWIWIWNVTGLRCY